MRSKNRLLKGKDLLWLRIISFCIMGVLLVAAGISVWLFVRHTAAQDETAVVFDEGITEQEQEESARELLHEDMLSGILLAGQGVCDALRARPEEVSIPVESAGDFATLEAVKIETGGTISISVTSPGLLASDDKYYYLFEEKIWQEEFSPDAEPLSRAYKDVALNFRTDLLRGSSSSRLFSRFYVAVKKDGAYHAVSKARYPDNPEALAVYNYSGKNHGSKKGLMIDPLQSSTNEWDDLGIHYCTYNFPLAHILGPTSNGAYPTINYEYHGRNWQFNGAHIHQYDYLFSILTSKGIDITGIILDDASTSAYPAFTHPAARSGSTAPYYMFNGVTADGVEALGAVATFLASRYSGGGHGLVHDWIIANEINARKEWNYMPAGTGIEAYTDAYAKAFRVFYNAIRSVNSGAGVYICLDQQWDRNKSNNPDYDARDVLDIFAVNVKENGDMDWGLAFHPYSCPLTQTAFWKSNSQVTASVDSSFITMKNIGIVTDYLHQDRFLNRNGEVRSVILSEQGFSSTAGQDLQAAAIAYAYKIAAANPDIDYFIYARETDHPVEIAQNLALGINNTGGGHKKSYNVYKHVDRVDGGDVISFALGIIGISGWP
ncbi:MAG: hypothetical protein K6G16_03730 [Lachnospiraceae bacterium]|nr:hypothetical protein [Lachnospiraceae bacterium]